MARKLKNPTITIEVEITDQLVSDLDTEHASIKDVLELGHFEAKMTFVDLYRAHRGVLLEGARVSVRLPR